LPDEETDPDYHRMVCEHYIHGPCRAPSDDNNEPGCLINGRCLRHFPRPFAERTTIGDDSYPIYRRSNNDRVVALPRGRRVDNRWVVPHNRYLTKRFDAHINVEICNGIGAVKYLYKYVYKGSDRARVQLTRTDATEETAADANDEIREYISGRYLSATEAAYRLLEFRMHAEVPNVVQLAVHLPRQQAVVYETDATVAEIVSRGEPSTTLIASFLLNAADPDATRFLYHEVPATYIFDQKTRRWRRRRRHDRFGTVGRMYVAHPGEGERYYLRLLLHHVRGATNYEDVRRIDGVIRSTFEEACRRRGLLLDDREWNECMTEAAMLRLPHQLRQLFVTILCNCHPQRPEQLWNAHRDAMTEKLLHRARQRQNAPTLSFTTAMYNAVLAELEAMLQLQGKSLERDFPTMPRPSRTDALALSPVFARELEYDAEREARTIASSLAAMNAEQRSAFDTVATAIDEARQADTTSRSRTFFLDGPGGTGKTFLYGAMLAHVRCRGRIALAAASSGIAALLLPGGRTGHKHFSIPLEINQQMTCNLPIHQARAAVIRAADLIVWDEAPMQHKYVFEAVDRALRDVMQEPDVQFGGKIVVFGGDFRQILPVVRRGGIVETVNATLRRSYIWCHTVQLRLRTNMRVARLLRAPGHDTTVQQNFADWLLLLGDGTLPINRAISPYAVRLPDCVRVVPSDHGTAPLVDAVYGNNPVRYSDNIFMSERAILAPTNAMAAEINRLMTDRISGAEHTYYSADTVSDDDDARHFPVELLNSLTPSGMPPHRLQLKLGTPVILLRNLNASGGQANGTRGIVSAMHRTFVECDITTGTNAGRRVYIPRILFTPADSDLPFTLQRRQLPLNIACSLTINKQSPRSNVNCRRPLSSHSILHARPSLRCVLAC
ncbi:unnamed protein product, partial [Phaeothamnion confervicola]